MYVLSVGILFECNRFVVVGFVGFVGVLYPLVFCTLNFFLDCTLGIWPCQACNAGFACTTGSYVPRSCVPGEAQPINKQSSCLSCSPGQYSNATERLICLSCLPGRFASASKSVGCSDCPAGRSTNGANSVVCASCDSGRFSPRNASRTCFDCKKGWSKNGTANTICGKSIIFGVFLQTSVPSVIPV